MRAEGLAMTDSKEKQIRQQSLRDTENVMKQEE